MRSVVTSPGVINRDYPQTLRITGMNRAERRRIQRQAAKLDEDLDHQIARVEQAIEDHTGEQREHYRALLRRLQQVRKIEPDL